ncbi:uncharacterized protein BDZ99DRAFT_515355 [Mytilinidion resinicola]|uniref:Uncharacterized protein n=1 Tax=Mytilinidion resinicola TaxID=574789 RepID=A0A6A6Z056_9PEZI|nr:uncharacterized protein BDZ99DRAFT_515355 [Mytilinidion resinicola]KAF2814566.1 hypothetical protein BDZ99DRAFT_515355 [Mytilinidion resinicola]
MLCDALLAIARSCVDLINFCKHFRISADKTSGRLRGLLDLAADLTSSDLPAWMEFKRACPLLPHGVFFENLRELKFAGNSMPVCRAKDQYNLLNYILKSSSRLEKLTLRGAGKASTIEDPIEVVYGAGVAFQLLCMQWAPYRDLLKTNCLTSLTLSCLYVHSDTVNCFLKNHAHTLQCLSLEGLVLSCSFSNLLAACHECSKLELLYVRAPFLLPPGPWRNLGPTVFGDVASR